MKNLQIKFLWQFLATIFLSSHGKAKKTCKPGQVNDVFQYFHVTARNVAQLNQNIIVKSNVLDWLECGELCLDTRFCVGYNFKKSSTDGQVNCELTDTGNHIFERIRTEDSDWTFYRTEGKQISECEEENECQNGGKMVWDPVKPFKCQCPKNYLGELCEKSNAVNDVEANITIDNGGSLMVDTGEKHNLTPDWAKTDRFALPGDTKVVTIKGDNGAGSPGGILASFSNGVVTDGTWECADMSSCTTTECENSVTWQGATTYGVNTNHPIYSTRPYIDSTAQWIWVDNQFAGRVWCKKTFGEITLKSVANTITYQEANLSCESDGKELCSSKVICKDGKTPYGGTKSGDHWAPVADSFNEWIQIGNSQPPCILHTALGSKPSWGLGNVRKDFKGHLFCCKI